jgi:hypothetical protein
MCACPQLELWEISCIGVHDFDLLAQFVEFSFYLLFRLSFGVTIHYQFFYSTFSSYFPLTTHSQSYQYITTDSQSASLSWCQVSGTRDQFFPSLFNYL